MTDWKSLLAYGLIIAVLAGSQTTAAELGQRQSVGDRVFDFDLPVVGRDDYIKLSDQYSQGPVVVVVLRGYPGYQCHICSSQVATLANRAKTLAKHAHRVIFIYPGDAEDLEKKSAQFVGARKLPEPLIVVRDQGMQTVSEWGLRWNRRRETAYPSTYVIDRHGRIRWEKVSQSHAGRSTVEEILKELRKL